MTAVMGTTEPDDPSRPLVADLTCKNEVWWVRTSELGCLVRGYHKARVLVGRFEIDLEDEKTCYSGRAVHTNEWSRTHGITPKLPTHCACGYQFRPADPTTRLCYPVLRLPDGREVVYYDLPPGCSWPDMEN